MKVAFTNSCKYIGGAELWQIRFARFLVSHGDQVCFFVRAGKFLEMVKDAGFVWKEIPMRFDLDLYSIFRLFQELKKSQPSIIIFNDQRDFRIGVISAGLAKVPLKIQRKGWSYLKGSFRDRFYYKRLDYVVAVSKAIERLFQDRLNLPDDKIWYLRNGVNLEKFNKVSLQKRVRQEGEVVIGMAGRLERQKRQSDLLRAGKILLDKGFKLKILFAGEGREKENLEILAGDLGISGAVEFLGFVDKIEEFLSGLDIFVFCSEWEGMPNAVLEAMASGKPVVATDIEGVRELIEDSESGLLYQAGNVDALARCIERLIQDRGYAERLGEMARRRVEEKFSEQKIFEEFREILIGALKDIR